MSKWIISMVALAAVAIAGSVGIDSATPGRGERSAAHWNESEVEVIQSMWIEALEPLPSDPTNRFGDDPRAVELGHRLFFDSRLSSNGEVSCASCHLPKLEFQDGLALGQGVGTTDRRTMPIAGTAYSPWQFWDGRKDSQWSQALGPLESAVEHGTTRTQVAHVVALHYRAEYERIFGRMPSVAALPPNAGPVDDPLARGAWDVIDPATQDSITRVFASVGKAIAAYERRIQFGASRFDDYAAALSKTGEAPRGILTPEEEAGLRLFIGKAQCTNCHNGPLMTDFHFHNTGVAAVESLPADVGRAKGAPAVAADEFNCKSRYSDADPTECAELDFLVTDSHELVRAFKPPSLRNVADRAPYMHAGQIGTLADVLEHYNRAPAAPDGHSELRPLKLSRKERRQLEAFLRTLSGGTDAPAHLLASLNPTTP